jgi:hypothetical protein
MKKSGRLDVHVNSLSRRAIRAIPVGSKSHYFGKLKKCPCIEQSLLQLYLLPEEEVVH